MPFRGIWNDPRNLQGSLGEILLMHPVRPRRRSRRDQPNDRTSHGVQSSRSPRCERYLLCYLLSSRPSAVRNVCRCRTACMPLPPSPRGKRGIGGCRCFVTLRLHPNAVAEIVSSQAPVPPRATAVDSSTIHAKQPAHDFHYSQRIGLHLIAYASPTHSSASSFGKLDFSLRVRSLTNLCVREGPPTFAQPPPTHAALSPAPALLPRVWARGSEADEGSLVARSSDRLCPPDGLGHGLRDLECERCVGSGGYCHGRRHWPGHWW